MSSPRDADVNRPHAVYRCFNAAGELLYVGVTEDVEHRMYHHLHPCNVGKQPNGTLQQHMDRYTAEWHPTRLAARGGERQAIATEAPLVNKQHNLRRFRKAGMSIYGLIEPVHPITAAAFPDLPRLPRLDAAA